MPVASNTPWVDAAASSSRRPAAAPGARGGDWRQPPLSQTDIEELILAEPFEPMRRRTERKLRESGEVGGARWTRRPKRSRWKRSRSTGRLDARAVHSRLPGHRASGGGTRPAPRRAVSVHRARPLALPAHGPLAGSPGDPVAAPRRGLSLQPRHGRLDHSGGLLDRARGDALEGCAADCCAARSRARGQADRVRRGVTAGVRVEMFNAGWISSSGRRLAPGRRPRAAAALPGAGVSDRDRPGADPRRHRLASGRRGGSPPATTGDPRHPYSSSSSSSRSPSRWI